MAGDSSATSNTYKMLVDQHISKLLDSYKVLIRRGQIIDDSVQRFEELQLLTASENIVSYNKLILFEVDVNKSLFYRCKVVITY